MTVSQLIDKLKKMPPGARVGTAMHDNMEYEIAGWVNTVYCYNKSDYADQVSKSNDADSKRAFSDNPKTWVTLHC